MLSFIHRHTHTSSSFSSYSPSLESPFSTAWQEFARLSFAPSASFQYNPCTRRLISRCYSPPFLALLLLSGDIELNPGPSNFCLCTVNIRSIVHPLHSQVKNRFFRHASPSLWNQLHKELRLPTDDEELSLSSDLTHVSSSFPSSPLSSSITRFTPVFNSRLNTHLFHKSFPPEFYLFIHWTDSTDSIWYSFFSDMSVLTLALCARLSWLPVSF